MSKIITLYHGTIYEFNNIDVSNGKGNRDFGSGFYNSRDAFHSELLALRNKNIGIERYTLHDVKKTIVSLLYTYEFDLFNLEKLKVKEFTVVTR
jgi:hypothetical protein